jgi:hypothetical protein
VTTVVNIKGHVRDHGGQVAPGQVYIGRQTDPRTGWKLRRSKWHNPFKVGRDGTIAEVLVKYEAHVRADPTLMAALPELREKVLACWCKPEPCHGDVLIRLLDELDA